MKGKSEMRLAKGKLWLRSSILCMLVALLTVGLVACDESEDQGTETTVGPTETSADQGATTSGSAGEDSSQQDVLKIGALLSLDSIQGVEMKKWLELFAKEYNDAGGWKIGDVTYTVQPMFYDVGVWDATKTRSAVEKAVLQDNVKYLVSNWGDVPAETLSITEPNKVLWLGLDFVDDSVKPTLNYAVRAQGLFFAQGLFYYICQDYREQGAQSVLVVCPDTQQGHVGAELVGATATATGFKVLDPVFFSADTTDFSPIGTKIASQKPDAVFFSYVAGAQLINAISALKDAGWKGFILPGELDGETLNNLVAKVGKDYVEGMETGSYDPRPVEKDPKIVKYIETYQQLYGDWHSEGCFWIGPWFFFEDAVNATQSTDVDELVAYLTDSKKGVRTLTGYSQLFARPDLQNFKTVDSAPGHYIGVVRDGKFEYLETIACKDQYLASIKVYGLKDVYQKYWDEYGYPEFPDQPARLDFSDL